ncbi:multiheme c-type cytochrome [Snuella lapsa]|uniref:Multiheme c-type cytochrome n=1 Tax=Snuella lapsa TaxID=870481 RepID=A0ABP6Y4H4_9FLAO
MGNKSKHKKSFHLIASLTILLVLSSILLIYFDNFSPTTIYLGITALHIVIGVMVLFLLLFFLVFHLKLKRDIFSKKQSLTGLFTLLVALICILSGLILTFFDISNNLNWIKILHPISAVLTLFTFFLHDSFKTSLSKLNNRLKEKQPFPKTQTILSLGLVLSLYLIYSYATKEDTPQYVALTPDIMSPGEALPKDHKSIDPKMLDGSPSCGTTNCHPDIYAQWNESMHHFSSFNNPYYRKSIDVLKSSGEGASTRWCASCHDPLPLLTGSMKDNLEHFDPDSHIAQAGITCLSCHAIQEEPHVKGNGKYLMDQVAAFNKLGDPMPSEIHKTLLSSNPEPHAKSLMNANLQSEKFCLSCHKVSIPPAVNNYRWKRGQNQYDSWQRSGVSGNNVRSFYFPDQPKNCIGCHMPNIPSNDKGNDNGYVKSHRFAAANTAVPLKNGHHGQLKAVKANLTSGIAELDIIKVKINGKEYNPTEPIPPMTAGDEVAIALLVNNRKVGHRLPAGTNDTNEWWLEVQAKDKKGNTVLASGAMDALGQIDSTAHYLRAILIDKKGNIIDKRNVNEMYAAAYNNTINPGSAHLVRYKFKVPEGITVSDIKASLKQRKFNWYYENLTFGGVQEGHNLGDPVKVGKKWLLSNPKKPDIPITTVATTTRSADKEYTTAAPLWKRWNDYGIGLFFEGDDKTAFMAFSKVDKLRPNTEDGAVNMARVLINEGSITEAMDILNESLVKYPNNKRLHYFLGKAYQSLGDYENAITHWMLVYEKFKTDFKLLLEISNAHYLLGEYEIADSFTTQALAVDPEDFGAIYQQLLIYQAQGKTELAETWKKKYQYYKRNEKEEFVIADFLEANPQIKIENNHTHYHDLHNQIKVNSNEPLIQ